MDDSAEAVQAAVSARVGVGDGAGVGDLDVGGRVAAAEFGERSLAYGAWAKERGGRGAAGAVGELGGGGGGKGEVVWGWLGGLRSPT